MQVSKYCMYGPTPFSTSPRQTSPRPRPLACQTSPSPRPRPIRSSPCPLPTLIVNLLMQDPQDPQANLCKLKSAVWMQSFIKMPIQIGVPNSVPNVHFLIIPPFIQALKHKSLHAFPHNILFHGYSANLLLEPPYAQILPCAPRHFRQK